jgi:hypothetical protein
MNNIINLKDWLKQANIFELEHAAQAYIIRKAIEDSEASEALRLRLENEDRDFLIPLEGA